MPRPTFALPVPHRRPPVPVAEQHFRRIRPGIEHLTGSFSLPRHRHIDAYATVVLAGSFEEAGYSGRLRATAGDVLIHAALDSHANRMVSAGVTLLRLDWPDPSGVGGLFHLNDVDRLARTAERDLGDATLLLIQALGEEARPSPGVRNDWPDQLVVDLTQDASTRLSDWSAVHGLARGTVTRGFTAAYGITPAGFRAEWRARAAWLRITRGEAGLSSIAAETGFADQAHMTRWIRRVTGAPPAVWRRRAGAEEGRPLRTGSGRYIME